MQLFTVLCLDISLRCKKFSMLTAPAKVQKNMGADCCAFDFCSWWCDGIHEEWKPEILGCRRHISPHSVLRPHSTPSEACLCVINWFRYTKSFSGHLLLCLAVLPTWILRLTLFWFRVPGISAALLSVMGSRFKKSGKIFPAGVVSLVSLVMVGGYFHGILRSSHA